MYFLRENKCEERPRPKKAIDQPKKSFSKRINSKKNKGVKVKTYNTSLFDQKSSSKFLKNKYKPKKPINPKTNIIKLVKKKLQSSKGKKPAKKSEDNWSRTGLPQLPA